MQVSSLPQRSGSKRLHQSISIIIDSISSKNKGLLKRCKKHEAALSDGPGRETLKGTTNA